MNRKLLEARKRRRWSQETAAEKIGISRVTYSRWENGEQEPHLETLDMACVAFAMSAEELGFAHLVEASPVATDVKVQSNRDGIITLTAEQITSLLFLLSQGDTMKHFDASRRAMLQVLGAAGIAAMIAPQSLVDPEPWERLSSAIAKPSNVNAATLDHFRKLTEACWQLSNGSELDVAEQVLPTFLPKLMQLAPYHQTAANLASQGLQLNSILVAHRLKLTDKVTLCQQSVEYARQAGDYNILVAALLQLAVAFRYAGQTENALKTYLEALHYSKQISPLLCSRVYIEAAEAFARSGRKQEALFYLGFARDTFPEYPENDPSFLFADCPYPVLFLYEGLVYLDLAQPQNALQSFAKIETYTLPMPERIRLEIVNHQGKAAIKSNDLDRYALCLQDGVAGALTLKSKKRFDEAFNIFHQDMPAAWLHDRQIKDIVEQYKLNV